MAFVKKTWQSRVTEYPNRRKLTNVLTGQDYLYTVERDEGVISAEGDAFSAGNMNNLEGRIESAFTEINSEISSASASVTNGKSLIAAAVTNKGVPTSATATFSQMAANINAISTDVELIENQTVTVSKYPGEGSSAQKYTLGPTSNPPITDFVIPSAGRYIIVVAVLCEYSGSSANVTVTTTSKGTILDEQIPKSSLQVYHVEVTLAANDVVSTTYIWWTAHSRGARQGIGREIYQFKT